MELKNGHIIFNSAEQRAAQLPKTIPVEASGPVYEKVNDMMSACIDGSMEISADTIYANRGNRAKIADQLSTLDALRSELAKIVPVEFSDPNEFFSS